MTAPPLPEQIELHRDRMWRRDEDLRVESAIDAERFIEEVGFANTLTDARRAGPSLYIAVCGRRDVSLPRNVQKDEETRLTWYLKDEVIRRGRVYYAKLAGTTRNSRARARSLIACATRSIFQDLDASTIRASRSVRARAPAFPVLTGSFRSDPLF
jgi:hypothetical protein